jgi:hypothetical protein
LGIIATKVDKFFFARSWLNILPSGKKYLVPFQALNWGVDFHGPCSVVALFRYPNLKNKDWRRTSAASSNWCVTIFGIS